MSLKLYGPVRSRAFRCVWALEELEMPFEHVQVDMKKGENRSEDFLKMNPYGKVPVLETSDGHHIFESAAICLYLADLKPEVGLAPASGSINRAQMNQWLHFGMTEIDAYLWVIARNEWFYGDKKSQEAIDQSKMMLEGSLKVLTEHLKDSEWMIGTQFTVADIVIGQALFWGSLLEIPYSEEINQYMAKCRDRDHFPNVKKYLPS
ncbi:MAG: glutathione S-transferase family protein [Bacteriovoracaceae bacterium]|nr:glutathione S-transferase family protein [Bacteriovoracaceae bacterium]